MIVPVGGEIGEEVHTVDQVWFSHFTELELIDLYVVFIAPGIYQRNCQGDRRR
jgi:hypothetical protein